mgnify:CR=1 FL=1
MKDKDKVHNNKQVVIINRIGYNSSIRNYRAIFLKAKFKCLKCEHKWAEKPIMVACPKCNHKYVKWTNYESLYKKHFKKMLKEEGL